MINRVMRSLEVLDELAILELEFHEYQNEHWSNRRCAVCGLPFVKDFHMNRGRPWWYSAYEFAAQREIADALIEWRLDRADKLC